MKDTVIILGGSGFIGKNLIEHLSAKYKVLSPTHAELDLLDSSSVANYLQSNKSKAIVYSVDYSNNRKKTDCTDVVRKNLTMFFNVANNLGSTNKLIFMGSGAEYDRTKDVINVKESDTYRIPPDDYGFYKYACTKFIEKNEKIIDLRLFSVFGPQEDYDIRFISNIICRIIFDLPVEVMRNRRMDFVYVKDLCKIVEFFIDNNTIERAFNIGDSRHMELIGLIPLIKEISGKEFGIIVKNPGMDKEYTCDNSLILKTIKGFQFRGQRDSISELYHWYEANKGKINKDDLLKYK